MWKQKSFRDIYTSLEQILFDLNSIRTLGILTFFILKIFQILTHTIFSLIQCWAEKYSCLYQQGDLKELCKVKLLICMNSFKKTFRTHSLMVFWIATQIWAFCNLAVTKLYFENKYRILWKWILHFGKSN